MSAGDDPAGLSVGPTYLAKPTKSEDGRPSGLGIGKEGCPLATSMWGRQ